MNIPEIYAYSASIYELSRIAKLDISILSELGCKRTNKDLAKNNSPYIQTLLNSLVNLQFADGSWGSQAYSFGDRLINTFGAITALAFNKIRWATALGTAFPAAYQQSLIKGIAWLESNVPFIEWYNPDKDDAADLAGLELAIYALREELMSYRDFLPELDTVVLYCSHLSPTAPLLKKARKKLQIIPRDLIFHPGSAISYVIEFTDFIMQTTEAELVSALTERGSIGNSPSTTAFVLDRTWNFLTPAQRDNILGYLAEATESTERNSGQLGWGSHYPMNHFLEIWHKYYLNQVNTISQSSLEASTEVDVDLLKTIGEQNRLGFGADYDFQIDADTTATYIYLAAESLVQANHQLNLLLLLDCLLEFYNERQGYFLTYPFELTPSVTTNVHVWQALDIFLKLEAHGAFSALTLPKTLAPERLQIIKSTIAAYIKSQATDEKIWQDKWHMTPSYATFHVVASGLLEQSADFTWFTQIANYFLREQSPVSGGWGFVKLQEADSKTFERCANPDDSLHTILILMYLLKNLPDLTLSMKANLEEALERGLRYLSEVKSKQPSSKWPALWCDKTLYAPYGILQTVLEQLLLNFNLRQVTSCQVA